MRLISVGINGYRRFSPASEMKVDGRVVAIVGPNEAGKTSLLRALVRLHDEEPFELQELTRGASPEGQIVWARYLLEPDDVEAIAHLDSSEDARWFVVRKWDDGSTEGKVEPEMRRDLGPRYRASDALCRAAAHRAIRDVVAEELEPEQMQPEADETSATDALLSEKLEELSKQLDIPRPQLPDDVPEMMRIVAGVLQRTNLERAPKYIRELADQLIELADREAQKLPSKRAETILFDRQPTFLLFGTAERNLRSDYDLSEAADDPPVALRNLAQLAGLDLVQMRETVAGGDYGVVEALTEAANTRLREIFEESWRQAGVTLRLRMDESVLRVLVSASSGGYTRIAERSDGLRWFIALLTYTALHSGEVKPVLLVDEAESHLHYDAQADLVRVFSRQQRVAKIIYTTHSAGCLPQDLGAGVRMVVPDTSRGTSKMQNAFWTEGAGFAPLLIGMGASVLAFTPTRFAVIAEGATEMILLPSLLREATGREDLGFQVAPSGAHISAEDIPSLDLEAARVVYLVDSDKAGRERAKVLRSGDVPEKLIVRLGGSSTPGLVLEDLLEASVYAAALNDELSRSHGSAIQIPVGALGAKERPAAVAAWCRQQRVEPPSKSAVAYRVLDRIANGEQVVATNRRKTVIALYQRLVAALRLEDLLT